MRIAIQHWEDKQGAGLGAFDGEMLQVLLGITVVTADANTCPVSVRLVKSNAHMS